MSSEGVATSIFIAPSHAWDAITVEALRQTGFELVSDGAALWPYEKQGLIFVPQLFPHPRHFGFGIYTLCIHLDTLDDTNFQRFLQFIAGNIHRIIAFEEAAKYTRNGPIARAVGAVLKVSMHYYVKGYTLSPSRILGRL
jgi:hypothetical protein